VFNDRSVDGEARKLFNEDRKNCLPIEEVEKTEPGLVRAIHDYLSSEDFLKVSGGKTWEEFQTENKGGLKVIVDVRSADAILTKKAEPNVKYIVKDTHDNIGVRDFLGTRSDLIVMIGHHKPVTKD